MCRTAIARVVAGLTLALLGPSAALAQTPMGTAWTYQGRIELGGGAYNGAAIVAVTLWDELSGGNQIGPVSSHNVLVSNGVFTITPDFGAAAFNGQARWIQIAVQTPSQPIPVTLSPRQAISPAPYALQTRGLFIDNTLSVGIGTTTPLAALDVVGQTIFPHLRVAARDSLSTPYGAFVSLDASPLTGGKDWLVYATAGAASEGTGKLIVRNYSDNAQGIAIDSTGNVGIGTYAPTQARLQIVSATTGIRVNAPDCGVTAIASGDGIALQGISSSGAAVEGTSAFSTGVMGVSSTGTGVEGRALNTATATRGVAGFGPVGVRGESSVQLFGQGVVGVAYLGDSTGVYGYATGGGMSVGVWGASDGTASKAGVFQGTVNVFGTLTKSGGSFRIDHPLDPANKFLSHSFVESPDMMNVYNGNVTTDGAGYATITMPDWFQALNRDFRYQLTVIDTADSAEFVQAKIVRAMNANQFTLRTSRPHTSVSWQVTGIRQDPWANANRIPVESVKNQYEIGRYSHPELYGLPASMQMYSDRCPERSAQK